MAEAYTKSIIAAINEATCSEDFSMGFDDLFPEVETEPEDGIYFE